MICSMTGYGEAQYHDGGISYVLELRTLNNRYFKAAIRLPEHLAVFEPEVEKLLRARLVRGSVTCNWRLRNTSAEAASDINVAALERYVEQLSEVTADGPVQKILHQPIMHLKKAAARGDAASASDLYQRIFGLSGPDSAVSEAAGRSNDSDGDEEKK